jgi:Tfp pilus assembly protein PilE
MHRSPPRGSTILEAAVVLVMVGLLSAIAVPRFLSSQARAHQAEVRSNLKAWTLAQRSFYEENARYTENLVELGYTVPRGNRYAYYFRRFPRCEFRDTAVPTTANPREVNCIAVDRYEHGMQLKPFPSTPIVQVTHTGEGLPPNDPGVTNGPEGWSPEGNISALASGHIDEDSILPDSWYVSTADASVSAKCGDSKQHLEAGTPINVYDAVNYDKYAGCP